MAKKAAVGWRHVAFGSFIGLALMTGQLMAQVLYDGVIVDRANLWDAGPAHIFSGGKHHLWWASQGSGPTDRIYYASKTGSLGPGGWSAPLQVIAHTQVPWADHHVADPSVIRGTFPYGGTTYTYALFFTADRTSSGIGTNNAIGVAFSKNGTTWTIHGSPVIAPTGDPTQYGAGMSGVSFNPINGLMMHVFLDTDYDPILRLNQTSDGLSFTPSPPLATQLHASGRLGNDGQGPDVAYNPSDHHWYAAIKNHDPQGVYDGETRVLRALTPDNLTGGWQVIGTINSALTGKPQNHNPGLGKNGDGSLFVDGQGWAYVFFTVGLERPAVNSWAVAQARFRPSLNLSVGKLGNGSGTVTSAPVGIQCGSDCSEAFVAGGTVTLSAVADTSSVFSAWSGDADCSDGVLAMTAGRSCLATFNSTISARLIWIQPQPLAGFGPPGSLVVAGSAVGATAGSRVRMSWRNLTTGSPWTIEPFEPLPGASGIWYHSIPAANYLQRYEVTFTYGGVAGPSCTYQGNNTITRCS